jgi:lipopolysaccharide export system ATP-binding protein
MGSAAPEHRTLSADEADRLLRGESATPSAESGGGPITAQSADPDTVSSSEPGAAPSSIRPQETAITQKEPRKSTVVLPKPDSPFGDVAGAPRRRARAPMPTAIRLVKLMKSDVPKPRPEPLLIAKELCKRFGKREVVRGVNLEVGPGEIVGLLGRNGAGKTTTFRMIVGMLRPNKGQVEFDLRNITRLPMYQRANRGLGYLAQEPSIFQRLNVEDNLLAVLELQVRNRKERMTRLEDLLRTLGLHNVRRNTAANLSGGERRRLEIARAMTLRPRVVLFDEPFAGIDPIAVTEIQDILRDLKNSGVGVLLTDHNVRETLTITDRTYIMDEGQIWIHGSPKEIVNHPEARSRYLGQGFRLDF